MVTTDLRFKIALLDCIKDFFVTLYRFKTNQMLVIDPINLRDVIKFKEMESES